MALIKFGGGVTQASGSIGGTTFARNRFGNYSRSRTKPVNPNTALQSGVRGRLAYLAEYWSSQLTAGERGAWATYAAAVASLNRLGESVYLTGFNHFLRSNTSRLQGGGAVIDAGPTVLTLPETDTTFAATFTASDQKVNITFNDALPWASEVGAAMYIYMGQPQNVTRNFFNGPWKYVNKLTSTSTSPTALTAPFTVVAGQKVWVYARIQRADGRMSSKFRFSGTAGA